jgi:antitoxin MazE
VVVLTKVQKWGNSLALRIPKAFAADAGLENESAVEISLVDGQIIVKPVTAQDWSLEQLLAGVTADNLHREIDTGEALGNEAW